MLQNTGPLQHFMVASAVYVSTLCWGPESLTKLCSVSGLPAALAMSAQTTSEMRWLGWVSKSSGKPWALHLGAVLELELVSSAALRLNQGWCLATDSADVSFLGLASEMPQHAAAGAGLCREGSPGVVWPTEHFIWHISFGPSGMYDGTTSFVQLKPDIFTRSLPPRIYLFYFKIQ